MFNLKANKKNKTTQKIDNQILVQAMCVLMLIMSQLQNGINQFQEANIVQVDQLKLVEEQSVTTDDYFNLDSLAHQGFQDIEFQYPKTIDYQPNSYTTDQQNQMDIESEIKVVDEHPQSLQYQYDLFFDLNNKLQNKILDESEIYKQFISYAHLYRSHNFKSFTKKIENNQNQKKDFSKATKTKNENISKHKFLISKFSPWKDHVKAIRTQFMQIIFHKLWKVPSQSHLKKHCFSGQKSRKQKIQIIGYLQQALKEIHEKYEDFQLKQEIYENIINKIVFCLNLALQLDNQADELIFDILFKGFIAELFNV